LLVLAMVPPVETILIKGIEFSRRDQSCTVALIDRKAQRKSFGSGIIVTSS
jgi:hypothetical protein